MSSAVKISVIIPTYNRRRSLARALETLFRQEFPGTEYEIVVVVDGSTDGTAEMLRGLTPACGFRVVEQPNRYQAAAMNVGADVARGELLLFIADDILCDSRLLREHWEAHGRLGDAVIFGPVHISEESPRSITTLSMRAWASRYFDEIERAQVPAWPDYVFVAHNCSIRRSLFLSVGGFDESFGRMCEDHELGIRLWKAGVRFIFRPSAKTLHVYRRPASQVVKREARWYGRAQVLLTRKHPEYRRDSALANLGGGTGVKRLTRQLITRLPFSIDPALGVPFCFSERLVSIPSAARAGNWLLERRRAAAMLRAAKSEAGSWQSLRAEFGHHLPVLLYHHVGPRRPRTHESLTVSPQKFESQIKWLARSGHTGIRPSDWLRWCKGARRLPEKPVLITFDDAYADLVDYAFPVLRKYGFGAGVFVVTKLIGKTNLWDEASNAGTHTLMNSRQIREWASEGIEFCSHSRTHADLITLSDTELEDEVAGSKKELEQIVGAPVSSFAYPFGNFDERVGRTVAGEYDLAFTVEEGLNYLRTGLNLLRRTMVQPGDTLADLACRVHMGRSPIHELRSRLRIRSRIAGFLGLRSQPV